MGTLILPASGQVYADTQVLIYSVEKHPLYGPLLHPLWHAVQGGSLEVVSSDLALMEVLVAPLRSGDTALAATYETFFQQAGMRLLAITLPILREAAGLRATTNLRTPDALHAATARLIGTSLFLTNDQSFRKVSRLPTVILDDLIP